MVGLYFRRFYILRTFFHRTVLMPKFRTLFSKLFSENFFGGCRGVMVKGTISVFPCDPSCKECNARFTIVPLKAICLIKQKLDINVFVSLNTFLISLGSHFGHFHLRIKGHLKLRLQSLQDVHFFQPRKKGAISDFYEWGPGGEGEYLSNFPETKFTYFAYCMVWQSYYVLALI